MIKSEAFGALAASELPLLYERLGGAKPFKAFVMPTLCILYRFIEGV
ncbi:MAG: hypothetical protein ABF868_00730 [Sporolactobacillus sp.]